VSQPFSCAAFDLGAGSGRAFLGTVSSERIGLEEAHRFHYAPSHLDGHLRWDMPRLFGGLGEGLQRTDARAQAAGRPLTSVGVDTWGVDYGLVDETGRLLEAPCSYRDSRTDGVMDVAFARVSRDAIFETTGLQFLPLNTLYQLVAHAREGWPAHAARLLMMPDLCHHWLCGSMVGEITNASTTQLLDAQTRQWSEMLLAALDLPARLMPELVTAGTDLGPLRPTHAHLVSRAHLRVVTPATHDTASAFAGTPLQPGWACISSGTWSLVGVERDQPLIDARVAAANFTNEAGVFGTVRFLKNVMGLWILESCRREWAAGERASELDTLLAASAALGDQPGFIDPDASCFFRPESMTRAVHDSLAQTDQRVPDDPATVTRVILDSLACRYATVVDEIEAVTGEPVAGIHIVGGGSRNDYLNQATANACDRPVLAGPVEATAAGNVLVQAIAAGALTDLADGRRRLAASTSLRRFDPRDTTQWRRARERYRDVVGHR
jgi:rhamnulokinase